MNNKIKNEVKTMIEKFNIATDENNEKLLSNKLKKATLLTIIIFLFINVFFVLGLFFSLYLKTNYKNEMYLSIYSHGGGSYNSQNHGSITYKLCDLKIDNSTITFSREQFTMKINGETYVCFGIYDSESKMMKDTYTIIADSEEEYVIVYYELVSFTYNQLMNEAKFFYNGKSVDGPYYRNMDLMLEDFIPYAILITIFITTIFFIANKIVRDKCRSKYKSNKFEIINKPFIDELKRKGFFSTKIFYMTACKTGKEDIQKMMIMVDNTNRKFAFVDYDLKIGKIVDFKDFVDYKIIENNGVVVESRAFVTIFDTLATTQTSRDVCKKLQLIIVLNDENDTNLVYNLVEKGLSINSNRYKEMSKTLVEVTSFFDVIKNNVPKDKKFIYCKHCGVKNDYSASHCSSCSGALD